MDVSTIAKALNGGNVLEGSAQISEYIMDHRAVNSDLYYLGPGDLDRAMVG